MRVLVDTSAFYASLSAADRYHEVARATYTRLLQQDDELLTTSYVVAEAAGLMQRRLGLPTLELFMAGLEAATSVVWVDAQLHAEAWREVRRVGRREVSLVDASVAAVARREDITDVFAYDPHFADWGLNVIG
jgi:predicted nucleic acid-binding protein